MKYRVITIRSQTGEELPVLVNADTGMPLSNPNLFVISELRARNLAANTLGQALRAIGLLQQFLDSVSINLDARLADGRILELGEIDELVAYIGMKQPNLDLMLPKKVEVIRGAYVSSLEKVRMTVKSDKRDSRVSSGTKAIRMIYIRGYLEWLVRRALLSVGYREPISKPLSDAAETLIRQLNSRMPSSRSRTELATRQGLEPDIRMRVLSVTHPESPENPWKNKHVRLRNYLVFRWLLDLGLRKGQLLGVRLEDINFRAGEVEIARRPDNPVDCRPNPAKNKGKRFLLPLEENLSELTRAYILGPRREIAGARKTPFLFVATGTGKPMSQSGVSKLFIELRRKVRGLPEELSPHVLRHTWNDQFSEFMDKNKVPAELEKKLRTTLMGWSDNSQMAARYTRRHIQRKAAEASLDMQAAAFKW